MGLYEVIEPCAFVNDDGSATEYRRPGHVVELTDEAAATVEGCLRPLGVEPREEAVQIAPETNEASGEAATVVEDADGLNLPVVDASDALAETPDPATEASEATSAPAAAVETEPKSRRRPGRVEGP